VIEIEIEIDIDSSTGITVYLSSFPTGVACTMLSQISQSTQVSSGHAGVPSTTSPGFSTEQSHETTTPHQRAHTADDPSWWWIQWQGRRGEHEVARLEEPMAGKTFRSDILCRSVLRFVKLCYWLVNAVSACLVIRAVS